MKKIKLCLLCPWSFILGFNDGMTNKILNINIFKILVGDSDYIWSQVEIFILHEQFQKPSKYYWHITDIFLFYR